MSGIAVLRAVELLDQPIERARIGDERAGVVGRSAEDPAQKRRDRHAEVGEQRRDRAVSFGEHAGRRGEAATLELDRERASRVAPHLTRPTWLWIGRRMVHPGVQAPAGQSAPRWRRGRRSRSAVVTS